MIPHYDHQWRAMRRICAVLADATTGVGAELAQLVSADSSLAGLKLPTPTRFVPLFTEDELGQLATNDDAIVVVYPSTELARVQMLGDYTSRTDEVVWECMVAVRLITEAGNTSLTESWAKVDFETRERRRLEVLMGAVGQVIARDARNGVDILSAIPRSRAEHGVQGISPERISRWARQPIEVLQHVLIPQFSAG